MGSIMKIGKVRPTYKGEWDSAAAYEVLDWVLYRGVAYQAVQDVPANREPDVTAEYWAQTGMRGDKGDKGDTGAQGPAGVNGRDGADGAQGPQGEQGVQGQPGIKGDTGAQGPQGVQGPRGVGPQHRWSGTGLAFENPDGTWAAPVDVRGAQGVQGPEGPVGPQGIPGPTGAQGPQGPQGAVGPVGPLPVLNNTVTSASATEAATANAVRVAYDRGTAAVNAAAAAQNTANEAKNITNLVNTVPAAWRVPQAGADGKIAAGWIGGGGTVPVGKVDFLPFRYAQLPPGWYFCNGTRYANGSAQANVLNAFSNEFKADWGIANNGSTTNVPNWFHSDGRGPVMRAVNGSSRQVGSLEEGAIQNVYSTTSGVGSVPRSGNIHNSGRPLDFADTIWSTHNSSGGEMGMSNLVLNLSKAVPTANEVRMLNRGMTPAIFLGV